MVCRSVCHTSEPCRNSCTDRDAIWIEDSGGPREPCITCRSRSAVGRGNFEGGEGSSHCKVQGHSAVISAKMAKTIEMLFGLWARFGCRYRVRWGFMVLRDVAMATNFGMQFVITGFVSYICGIMICSDMLFDSRIGFSG